MGNQLDNKGLPRGHSGKKPTCQCRRCGLNPWVGKIPWRRKWQPTLVFLPEKSHGQRSLVGMVHGVKKSQTEQLSTQPHTLDNTVSVSWEVSVLE